VTDAPPFVVVTGLPGSGKSTVGLALHRALSLTLIDKDDVLESLFDSLGSPDLGARESLSRAADEVVLRVAASSPGAILVNWWHRETAGLRLARLSGRLVEVLCDASPEVCATRWTSRVRHPGHHDGTRPTPPTLPPPFEPMLRPHPLVRVDTSEELDEVDLVGRVRTAIGSQCWVPSTAGDEGASTRGLSIHE
jgi:predicted kinase